MSSLHRSPERLIAKTALMNFFLPLINALDYLKYAIHRRYREEAIDNKISKMASELHEQNNNYQEVRELISTVQAYMLTHENRMLVFSKEIADARRFLGRQNLYSSALENHSRTLASHIGFLANSTLDLKTRKLSHGEFLTTAAAEIGMANIEFLLKGIKKNEKSEPFLFGVNKGGQFLAAYLAKRMQLAENHIVDCVYGPDAQVVCEDRDITGSIVLIDDVTRTGKTLNIVKNYLNKKYPNAMIVSFVLVTAVPDQEAVGAPASIVDYSPWVTGHLTVSLPWSSPSEDKLNETDYFNELEMDQIVSRLEFDG